MATSTTSTLPLSGVNNLFCSMKPEFKKPIIPKKKAPAKAPSPADMLPPTNFVSAKPKITPKENDVLCGKTRQCLVHHGSVQFRYLIESYTERYEAAEDKYSKMSLTREIYNRVSQTSRFLRFNQKDGGWEELTPAVARDKVGHALRFSSLRRNKKPRRPRAPQQEIAISSAGAAAAPPQEVQPRRPTSTNSPCPPQESVSSNAAAAQSAAFAPHPQVVLFSSVPALANLQGQQAQQVQALLRAAAGMPLPTTSSSSQGENRHESLQRDLDSLISNYERARGTNNSTAGPIVTPSTGDVAIIRDDQEVVFRQQPPTAQARISPQPLPEIQPTPIEHQQAPSQALNSLISSYEKSVHPPTHAVAAASLTPSPCHLPGDILPTPLGQQQTSVQPASPPSNDVLEELLDLLASSPGGVDFSDPPSNAVAPSNGPTRTPCVVPSNLQMPAAIPQDEDTSQGSLTRWVNTPTPLISMQQQQPESLPHTGDAAWMDCLFD